MLQDKKFEVIGAGQIVRKITRKAAELIGKHKAIETGPIRPLQEPSPQAKPLVVKQPVEKAAKAESASLKAAEKGGEGV